MNKNQLNSLTSIRLAGPIGIPLILSLATSAHRWIPEPDAGFQSLTLDSRVKLTFDGCFKDAITLNKYWDTIPHHS